MKSREPKRGYVLYIIIGVLPLVTALLTVHCFTKVGTEYADCCKAYYFRGCCDFGDVVRSTGWASGNMKIA